MRYKLKITTKNQILPKTNRRIDTFLFYSHINVEIYIDGELKHSVQNITKTTGPLNFNLDVSNSSTLTFKISNDYTGTYWDTSIVNVAIVNTKLVKAQ